MSGFTGSGQYVVMARKAVQLDAGLVRIMAVWSVGNTLMVPATNEYWEIIAANLSKAGWSWGCVSAIDSSGRPIWIVDAHRDNGKRFVVRAD
jgi:hypothetical protein